MIIITSLNYLIIKHTSMCSTNNSMDIRVKSITILINNIIQFRLNDKTMNDSEANILSDMLIRIQPDTALLDVIINFYKSLLALKAN